MFNQQLMKCVCLHAEISILFNILTNYLIHFAMFYFYDLSFLHCRLPVSVLLTQASSPPPCPSRPLLT